MSWMKSKQIEPLTEKLRRIVLSSAPLNEIDTDLLRLFDFWRDETSGKFAHVSEQEQEERVNGIMRALDGKPRNMGLLWEPLSNVRGETIRHYGWYIEATIYLLNEQPWWFVKANHNRDRTGPTESEIKRLDKVIELLGCADCKRDLMRYANHADGLWARYYSWFHHGPLLETHENRKTHALRIVPEGTPLADGFERVPRLDINNLPK